MSPVTGRRPATAGGTPHPPPTNDPGRWPGGTPVRRVGALSRGGAWGCPCVELTDDVVAAATAVTGRSRALSTRCSLPKVLGYLRAHGAEDPEGLTNEVFLHVLRRLGGLVGGAAGLRTFVFSVAHARLVDECAGGPGAPWSRRTSPISTAGTSSPRSTQRWPARRADHLDRMLERLNHDQRSVITLRVLGDLTLEQTAEILGKTTGAVKQLQRRGLLTLRSMMERGEVAL